VSWTKKTVIVDVVVVTRVMQAEGVGKGWRGKNQRHCYQIAENSAKKLKYCVRKKLLRREIGAELERKSCGIIFKKSISNKYSVGPMASTAEHKLTAWDKFLFGVLNTKVFSGKNAKRTCFSSQNEILLHKTKSQKNSGICLPNCGIIWWD
jgi:hypothetical protein